MQQLRTILSLPKQTGILFRKIKMHVDAATRIFTVRTVLLIIRVIGTVIPVAARGIGNRPPQQVVHHPFTEKWRQHLQILQRIAFQQVHRQFIHHRRTCKRRQQMQRGYIVLANGANSAILV